MRWSTRIERARRWGFALAAFSCTTALGCGSKTTQGLAAGGVGGISNEGGRSGSGGEKPSAAGKATSGTSSVAGATGGDAGVLSDCYSPEQNLDTAYEPGARGCACDAANDPDICSHGVALICEQSFWQSVLDGPCWVN